MLSININMENIRPIKKTFLDRSGTIYVVDNTGIIYMYEGGEFYPFVNPIENIMHDIKNCFLINSTFFVYHSNTISMFDENLFRIELDENTWITHNIDFVCYHSEYDLVAILKNSELFVYTNVSVDSNDEIVEIPLSHICKYDNGEIRIKEYNLFDHIKIVDNILLALNENDLSVFLLEPNNEIIRRISRLNVNKKLYDRIINYNDEHNIFILNNGNYLTLDGIFHIPNNYLDKTFNNFIFNRAKCFFLVENDMLLCYYEQDKYDTVIKEMLNLLSNPKHTISDVSNKSHKLLTLSLPNNINFDIINSNFSQLIICNGEPYIIEQNWHKIVLTDNVIYFDRILEYYPEKTDTKLLIDIDVKRSVVDQLINSIPSLYRLNNEMIYCFEQINFRDQDGEDPAGTEKDTDEVVLSYGEGVTRQVFNDLRKELDKIMENKFIGLSPHECYNLGKLLYFCNRDGHQTFESIHPYFFYLLSNKTDDLTLLQKFKGSDYQLHHDQYIQFTNNPHLLENLDLGLLTPNDFIKYILNSDLTPKEIILYENFFRGYLFFAKRHKLRKLIKNFPIKYHIETLVATNFFDAELEYNIKSYSVSKNNFKMFCFIFRKLFDKLTKKEKSYFLQNVTGSCYYNGVVKITLGYEEKELITTQTVYNEDVIGEDAESISDIIIGLDTSENESTTLSYSISTCNTELIINTKPTEENLIAILNLLIIEDSCMRN